MEKGKLEPLSAQNSVLLLVDYQRNMYTSIGSGNRNEIHNGAIATATAASILKVPTVLTSIWTEGNGPFESGITELFPDRPAIEREMPGFDAFEDKRVFDAVRKTDRKKLILGGLWTSICMGFTALHALREGYQVYGIMDAIGDVSPEAHAYGIRRMVQAGVVPMTWMAVTAEWMHDWENPKAGTLKKEVFGKYDIVLGFSS